jgi:hypothetical protein
MKNQHRKKYFTVKRHSGFGDYASTVKKICHILGESYEFVVLKGFEYTNYHCPSVNFLELFYNGNYIDEKKTKQISLKEALNYKLNNEEYFDDSEVLVIEPTEEDWLSLLNVKSCSKNIFSYKPKSNPFKEEKNKAVLHIRASDILKSKRRVVDPSKVAIMIEQFSIEKINLIICSDLESESATLSLAIENLKFDETKVKIIKKIIGRNSEKTIETMDSFYNSDYVFSTSSCFIHLFNTKLITIPADFCFDQNFFMDNV